MLNTIKLKGTVVSGQGDGKKYLSLPWARQQIEEILGYSPYLGTLNLKLNKESGPTKGLLKNKEAYIVYPEAGYCSGILFRAQISGLNCAVIIPQVLGYDESLLEIIAEPNLRQALKIRDGDAVEIFVSMK